MVVFFLFFVFLAQPWVKSAQIKQYLKTVACLVFCPENLCLCSCICFLFKCIQVKNLQTVWVHRRLLVQTANLDKLFPDCNDFCPWAKPVVIILQHLIKFHVPAIPLTFILFFKKLINTPNVHKWVNNDLHSFLMEFHGNL